MVNILQRNGVDRKRRMVRPTSAQGPLARKQSGGIISNTVPNNQGLFFVGISTSEASATVAVIAFGLAN